MRCPERRAAAKTFDFGERIALAAASQESTVFDAMPLRGANAVRVSLAVPVVPAASQLTAVLLAGNDEENFTQIASTNINAAGIYTFASTAVAHAFARLGLQASGPAGSFLVAASAQLVNA